MRSSEIMEWLEGKALYEDTCAKCLKRRVTACVRGHNSDFPGPKYLCSPAKAAIECKGECRRKGCKPGETDYMCPSVHAEVKAILGSVIERSFHYKSLEGCDLFVTHFPCKNCALLSIYVGITRIFYRWDYYNTKDREGREAVKYVEFFLKESGVKLFKI